MMFFAKFKLHYWPILSCSWAISSFITTFIISICNGHVYPLFPYISDTGTKPPESCIFAQLLNLEAMLLAITLCIRYKQVELAICSTDTVIKSAWNVASLVFGFICCLGISMVANFQETNILEVHLLGAFFVFGIGVVYFILQVRITLAFRNLTHSIHRAKRWVVHLRLLIAICLVPLFFTTSICSIISLQHFTGESMEYWTEEDGGFTLRLASTFGEWMAVFLMMTFVLTFAILTTISEEPGATVSCNNPPPPPRTPIRCQPFFTYSGNRPIYKCQDGKWDQPFASCTLDTNVCKGDNGGSPYFKFDDRRYFIMEIVSISVRSTVGCDSNRFALYTKMSTYLPWLESITRRIY